MADYMTTPTDLYGKPWTNKEYLIVLGAYFQTRGQPNDVVERAIHDVSHLIGRTNRSVGMRFANFASIDPEFRDVKRGLDHVDRNCRSIFAEWMDRPHVLYEVAKALRSELDGGGGGVLFDLHRVRLPFAFRRYELGDLLGEGSFGAVYSCVDTKTDEPRAIKILRLDRIEDASMIHRFRREIKVLRTVSHPNVIALHEDNLETEERFPAFVMDLAECSLPQFVAEAASEPRQRPVLPALDALKILTDVITGVVALHEHEPAIIHRDLNPNNILRMRDGRWVVADFTLSKFAIAASQTYVTATTTRGWGTMYYAAPEQWSDFKDVDHRCDIYALGAVIWDLFSSAWPPPHESSLQLSSHIDAVVRKAMARERSHRHATARDLVAELTAAVHAVNSDSGSVLHDDAAKRVTDTPTRI
jgi:tRNA A-37 threonylcarbamoyl transferase component Bud32